MLYVLVVGSSEIYTKAHEKDLKATSGIEHFLCQAAFTVVWRMTSTSTSASVVLGQARREARTDCLSMPCLAAFLLFDTSRT